MSNTFKIENGDLKLNKSNSQFFNKLITWSHNYCIKEILSLMKGVDTNRKDFDEFKSAFILSVLKRALNDERIYKRKKINSPLAQLIGKAPLSPNVIDWKYYKSLNDEYSISILGLIMALDPILYKKNIIIKTKLEPAYSELSRIKETRASLRLKEDSPSVIAYLKVIARYLSNSDYTEYETCKDIYHGDKYLEKKGINDKGFTDETSFRNSFRKWCNSRKNKNKYSQIKIYLDERKKRIEKKKIKKSS